ncbi:hypothetical protein [Alkalicoccobacillus murimartini]|uniref:Uncharacterized protein n=1 Tax=Alkalicoccobacillus murimartini TaxID=171685 RepID=A0ABT9YK81_9BACI|nr:hypothetical protein [Alkalicoccobacillus murimartini]MDQ0207434.1 hypothetical protein [Alkalicoccobacillus murimartini]
MSKRIIYSLIIVSTIGIGLFILINNTKYTSFDELYSDQINEESTIQKIDITIDTNIDSRTTSIEDESIIAHILSDLSSIELKDEDGTINNHTHRVSITTTNQLEDRLFSTDRITLRMNHQFFNQYRIVSETHHLATINSLVERDDINWDIRPN